MKPVRTLLLFSALLALQPSGLFSDTLRLTPAQDALVRSDNSVSENPRALAVANRGEGNIRRTLLQFELAPVIRSGRSVKSATLLLIPLSRIGDAAAEPVPFAVWGVTDIKPAAWDEKTVTWETSPLAAASLEVVTRTAGAVRLGSTEVDLSEARAFESREPFRLSPERLAGYVNWALARGGSSSPLPAAPALGEPLPIITLVVTSEGGNKAPGAAFYSKDNRPEARAVYPVLELILE
ncbi:hypothetical protein OpiT1DRAFT_01861 [Opitutaceae bacterium TAV1]|nr:hypothetical protein OpiT1DRAFT_01861 [Opitutaceae bacterium TAV1]